MANSPVLEYLSELLLSSSRLELINYANSSMTKD